MGLNCKAVCPRTAHAASLCMCRGSDETVLGRCAAAPAAACSLCRSRRPYPAPRTTGRVRFGADSPAHATWQMPAVSCSHTTLALHPDACMVPARPHSLGVTCTYRACQASGTVTAALLQRRWHKAPRLQLQALGPALTSWECAGPAAVPPAEQRLPSNDEAHSSHPAASAQAPAPVNGPLAATTRASSLPDFRAFSFSPMHQAAAALHIERTSHPVSEPLVVRPALHCSGGSMRMLHVQVPGRTAATPGAELLGSSSCAGCSC